MSNRTGESLFANEIAKIIKELRKAGKKFSVRHGFSVDFSFSREGKEEVVSLHRNDTSIYAKRRNLRALAR